MQKKVFVTGISTEVGKTIVSAIITESLKADYWKPIQAGELENSDADKVRTMVSNSKTIIHPNSYALRTAMSPHEAANIDQVKIKVGQIVEPVTKNHLVIEGAGGVLVPLNDNQTILDIIEDDYHVVVVSRHYLGSINHTLMTINMLKDKGHTVSLVFSGDEHQSTEYIIQKMTGVSVIGRVGEEPVFDQQTVKKYADLFAERLAKL